MGSRWPRRTFLRFAGAPTVAALTGYVSGADSPAQTPSTPTDEVWPQTHGNDDEPIEADPGELLLTANDMPRDGWRVDDERDFADERGHERTLVRGDVTVGHIAWVLATVEKADTYIQDWHDRYDSYDEEEYTYATKEHDIASAGFYVVTDEVWVWFRDANAAARMFHNRKGDEPEEGDLPTTLEIAAAMHRTWRS